MADTLQITFRLNGEGPFLTAKGRDAWCLMALIAAGPKGCTPIERPAPRWSAYVHNLRNLGVLVETIHEPHSGPFAGHHGRYVLRSAVTLKETVKHGAA